MKTSCDICDAKFSKDGNLRRHMRNSHKAAYLERYTEATHKCEKCGKHFSKKGFHSHKTKCRIHICKYCELRCHGKQALQKHVGMRHKLCEGVVVSDDEKDEKTINKTESEDEKANSEDLEQCLYCDQKFSRSNLVVHKNKCWKWKNNFCNYCSLQYHNRSGLLKHFRNKHSDKIAEVYMINKEIAIKHEEGGDDIKPDGNENTIQNCFNCGLKFSRKGLIQHEIYCLKHKEKPFCKKCGVQFSDPSALRRHTKRKHRADTNLDHASGSTEDVGQIKITEKASLEHEANSTINVATGNSVGGETERFRENIVCHICGKTFATKGGYDKHKRWHAGIRFTCEICHKVFTTNSALKCHMRLHRQEKPYICDICGRRWTQLSHLYRHTKTHTGERTHFCKLCHKGFMDSSALKTHEKIHYGIKPYHCELCEYKCVLRSALKLHKRSHFLTHDFKCRVCERTFTQKHSLIKHEKMHMRDTSVKPAYITKPTMFCNRCFKGFITKRGLVRHMQKHEKGVLRERIKQDSQGRSDAEDSSSSERSGKLNAKTQENSSMDEKNNDHAINRYSSHEEEREPSCQISEKGIMPKSVTSTMPQQHCHINRTNDTEKHSKKEKPTDVQSMKPARSSVQPLSQNEMSSKHFTSGNINANINRAKDDYNEETVAMDNTGSTLQKHYENTLTTKPNFQTELMSNADHNNTNPNRVNNLSNMSVQNWESFLFTQQQTVQSKVTDQTRDEIPLEKDQLLMSMTNDMNENDNDHSHDLVIDSNETHDHLDDASDDDTIIGDFHCTDDREQHFADEMNANMALETASASCDKTLSPENVKTYPASNPCTGQKQKTVEDDELKCNIQCLDCGIKFNSFFTLMKHLKEKWLRNETQGTGNCKDLYD